MFTRGQRDITGHNKHMTHQDKKKPMRKSQETWFTGKVLLSHAEGELG